MFNWSVEGISIHCKTPNLLPIDPSKALASSEILNLGLHEVNMLLNWIILADTCISAFAIYHRCRFANSIYVIQLVFF